MSKKVDDWTRTDTSYLSHLPGSPATTFWWGRPELSSPLIYMHFWQTLNHSPQTAFIQKVPILCLLQKKSVIFSFKLSNNIKIIFTELQVEDELLFPMQSKWRHLINAPDAWVAEHRASPVPLAAQNWLRVASCPILCSLVMLSLLSWKSFPPSTLTQHGPVCF